MSSRLMRTAALAGLIPCGAAFAQVGPAPSRGELLYATHCTHCHTTQMHWRDNRAATDWPGLKFQVRRWQGVLSLGWTEADVVEVSTYLNQNIYRFEQTSDSRSSMAGSVVPAGLTMAPVR